MVTQIAICDDNKNEMTVLKQYIQEIMDELAIAYNLVEFDSGEKLLETDMMFHIVFLDIVMGEMNGIETGRKIYKKNNSIKIIYQTSFADYLEDAINKSHAFAYLNKPVQKETIRKQILEFLENEKEKTEIYIDFERVTYIKDGREAEKKILSLPIQKIIYFEYMKMQRKVKIVTEQREYIYITSIGKLEQKMRPLGFEVCCRGILVNLSQVENLKGNSILLGNGSILALSQRRVAEFKERMNEYLHNS